MGTLLLRPFMFRPHTMTVGVGLGLSIVTYAHLRTQFRSPLRLDSGTGPILSSDSYRTNAKTPVVRGNGRLNPAAVRQISSGSIIGLCGGILVSTFSRPLALLIGLLVVGVQWASSYGIQIIPYNRVQKYVAGVDLRSIIQDNVAFKLSFGTTFAMAAFMHF